MKREIYNVYNISRWQNRDLTIQKLNKCIGLPITITLLGEDSPKDEKNPAYDYTEDYPGIELKNWYICKIDIKNSALTIQNNTYNNRGCEIKVGFKDVVSIIIQ